MSESNAEYYRALADDRAVMLDQAREEIERLNALLRVYMRHVIDCESISFLNTYPCRFGGTDEQMDALRKIEEEIDP